ncbi:MAG: hypothetical protein JXR37_24140 [Kiritimatiellae bacterium]|nr:hypothetical protein [Kiritimatiellia bacterium]
MVRSEDIGGATGGVPQLGLCMMYPAPGIIEAIGPDWDWIWIDGQHGELGYGDVLGMVRAANLIERPAIVRVASHDYGAIGRALDTGADGVILPMVDTPKQAEAAVKAAKFPPIGQRSYGGRRPVDLHGRDYTGTANEDTLLIVQIETPEALVNAEAIAAVPGVDALFLGPDDLMLRRGHPMAMPKPKDVLAADMQSVVAACARHGKLAVTVGIGADMFELCLRAGFHLIVAGGDVFFLADGSRCAAAAARRAAAGTTAAAACVPAGKVAGRFSPGWRAGRSPAPPPRPASAGAECVRPTPASR